MFAEERHQAILRRARADGRVDVASLSEEFAVTPETIRRDLTVLERAGHVRRVHGGAIPLERFGFEPSLSARASAFTAEKQRIAKAALAELPEAGAILLDAGTTTREFAAIIPGDRELLVVVNSPEIAMTLSDRSNDILMLGASTAHVGSGRRVASPAQRRCADVAFMAAASASARLTTAIQRGPGEAVDDHRCPSSRAVGRSHQIGTDCFASVAGVALVTDSTSIAARWGTVGRRTTSGVGVIITVTLGPASIERSRYQRSVEARRSEPPRAASRPAARASTCHALCSPTVCPPLPWSHSAVLSVTNLPRC